MFLVMFESTKKRTNELESNENISFPIGTNFLSDSCMNTLVFAIFPETQDEGYRN